MEKSLKFKNVEKYLRNLLNVLYDNEDFKKYVFHLDDEPLNHPNVQADLIENGNIILNLFDPNVLKDTRVTLFIYPSDGMYKDDDPLGIIVYVVDIVTPYSKWLLPGFANMRAVRIADEIAKEVDQRTIMANMGSTVSRWKTFKVNSSTPYSGLTFQIKVTSSAMKGVR